MVVGAKVCELTEDLLWFVCGLYVGILTSPLREYLFILTPGRVGTRSSSPWGRSPRTPRSATTSRYCTDLGDRGEHGLKTWPLINQGTNRLNKLLLHDFGMIIS